MGTVYNIITNSIIWLFTSPSCCWLDSAAN